MIKPVSFLSRYNISNRDYDQKASMVLMHLEGINCEITRGDENITILTSENAKGLDDLIESYFIQNNIEYSKL